VVVATIHARIRTARDFNSAHTTVAVAATAPADGYNATTRPVDSRVAVIALILIIKKIKTFLRACLYVSDKRLLSRATRVRKASAQKWRRIY
jgi:hypothetical protein